MARALSLPGLFTATLIFAASALAQQQQTPANCGPELSSSLPVTARSLKDRSRARAERRYAQVPRPGFDNIEELAKIEQVGEEGPRALRDMLPASVSFVSTPAPTSPDPIAVDLIEEGRSFATHVDTIWHGRRAGTSAFVSDPNVRAGAKPRYVIGREHKTVLVYLHGGGTPTATGRNGMTMAAQLAKRGIPVVGIDMPGHGRATRNPTDMTTFAEMADYLMEVIDQTIDPSVKIVLTGHSWGAAFVVWLHRHSDDPKYARIAHYVAMSPPVDVSLGGNLREKLDFEQRYQREFPKFKDRIAPADFEFQSNMLNNGKNSDVGAYFTSLTDFDFKTPPLSEEEQRRLKPLTVIVGEADGLVYVGREEQYRRAYGNLVAPSRFILLGPGRTWKTKQGGAPVPTGHNIFDLLADCPPGEKDCPDIPLVYQMLGDITLEGGADFEVRKSTGDAAEDVMDRVFRNYANFFGFRELIENHVEYVLMETMDRPKISKRKGELDDYLKRTQPFEDQIAKIRDGKTVLPEVQNAIDDLRTQLGITEKITLEQAQGDLAMPPLTDARREELKAFIEEVKAADAQLKANYTDTAYDNEMRALEEQFKGTLERAGVGIGDYQQLLNELQERKDPKEERLRSELSHLHQLVAKAIKDKARRFAVAQDARRAAIKNPGGVRDHRQAEREMTVDRSEARLAKLREFVSRYPVVERDVRRAAVHALQAKMDALNRPEGVSSPADARALKAQQDKMLDLSYEPADDPVLASLGRRIGALFKELAPFESGDAALPKLAKKVKELRLKRAAQVKKWDELWKSGTIGSENIREREANLQRTLENYKNLYFNYEDKKADWLLSLKESGQLSAANILNMPANLRQWRTKVQRAKQVYFRMRAEFETLRWTEAILGRIEGDAKDVKSAVSIAKEVWGEEYPKSRKPGMNSLTQVLRMEEDYLSERQAQQYLKERELYELQGQYAERAKAKGMLVPFQVHKRDIGRALNQPLPALLTELRSDPILLEAFTQTLAKWENILGPLRSENQSKDGGGY